MEDLQKQLADWHDRDNHEQIIDTIENLREDELTSELIGILAVAYNNIGDHESLSRSIELLYSLEKELSKDCQWNYRIGFALYYLDSDGEALIHFKRVLTLDPDNEQVKYFIEEIEANLED